MTGIVQTRSGDLRRGTGGGVYVGNTTEVVILDDTISSIRASHGIPVGCGRACDSLDGGNSRMRPFAGPDPPHFKRGTDRPRGVAGSRGYGTGIQQPAHPYVRLAASKNGTLRVPLA